MTCKAGYKQPTRNNSGFTLLEVMVSLTIMALITTVAFAALSIAIDTWHRGSQRIDDLDRRFSAERLLVRQVTLADSSAFRGDSHQLEFTTAYSLANGPGDTVWVRYEIDANANGFIYSETPLAQYVPGQPAVTRSLTGFSVDGFKYLYTMPNKEREWMNQTMLEKPGKNEKKESVLAVRVSISGDTLNIPTDSNQ